MGDNTLENMSLEELWKLFPIELVPHNPAWMDWVAQEIDSLQIILKKFNPEINHIGSTAIPKIHSKPIVDILVETSGTENWNDIEGIIISNGYIRMSRNGHRMSFNKGYTIEGYSEKVFHIHFHEIGDNNEILFRDYLNENPSVAKDYERLKFSLLRKFKNDRDAYTGGKTEFIRGVIMKLRNS